MASAADDVADTVDEAKTVLQDEPTLKITGFATAGALNGVEYLWNVKLTNCSSRWTSHAEALRATADDVDAADEANAWSMPEIDPLNGGR